jgi:hypothetical protein
MRAAMASSFSAMYHIALLSLRDTTALLAKFLPIKIFAASITSHASYLCFSHLRIIKLRTYNNVFNRDADTASLIHAPAGRALKQRWA